MELGNKVGVAAGWTSDIGLRVKEESIEDSCDTTSELLGFGYEIRLTGNLHHCDLSCGSLAILFNSDETLGGDPLHLLLGLSETLLPEDILASIQISSGLVECSHAILKRRPSHFSELFHEGWGRHGEGTGGAAH